MIGVATVSYTHLDVYKRQEQGRQQMQLKVGATAYTFHIDVVESGIDISEATYGLQVKLSPVSYTHLLWREGVQAGRFKVKFREPEPII